MIEQTVEEKIWIALAELFFLDTAMDEDDFNRVATFLNSNGWSREKTEQTLVQLIAPVAGANVGYLIIPIAGEWTGFNENQMSEKIRKHREKRTSQGSWRISLSDWWCRRMLKDLGVQRLLEKLST